MKPRMLSAVATRYCSVGASRCGRISVGVRTCTRITAASVTASATTVRRTTSPTATPRANAKAAYPIGTRPRALKTGGNIRGR